MVGLLCFVIPFFLSSFQDGVINKKTRPADDCGHNDENNRSCIILGSHRVATESRKNDRGEACRRGQGNVKGNAHIGQTDGVGQKILRGAGDGEQDEGQGIALFGLTKNGQGIDLLLGVEGLDQTTAEMPHQKQGSTASQYNAAEAQKGTDPASEAVSRRNLHYLAGDEGDHDLHR